jgi:hypothetical protein
MFTEDKTNLRPLRGAAAGAALLFVTACGGSLTPATAPGAITGMTAQGAAAAHGASPARTFTYTTLDDASDPTFNQLLGINKSNVIAGYFGIGAPGHPNKGYILNPPYGQSNYVNENFPGSVQTQVTAINNKGDLAGFWVSANNTNRGWVMWNGVFTSYKDHNTPKMPGTVNQLLGLNDAGTAVGFYNDATGNSHAFTLDQRTGKFTAVNVPGASSAVASGINSAGDIVGIAISPSGTAGFLKQGHHLSALQFPGGSNTQPFGVNNKDAVVGSYLDGGGVLHGFLVTTPLTHARWTSIDDPNGVGSTVVNGLNDRLDLVGFYTDPAGNTDGMLVTP